MRNQAKLYQPGNFLARRWDFCIGSSNEGNVVDEQALSELVVAAQQGNVAAFTEIVRRFEGMALRIGTLLLSNRQRAEDAAQEAFLDAYLSLHNLREPAAFPGWFRRVVLKHCDRQLRRERGEVPLVAEARYSDGSPDMLDTFDTRSRLSAALATLNRRQRLLVRLFYVEGYSQAEIVKMLGCSLPTVKKQLFVARTRMREEMHDMSHTATPATQPSPAQRVEFFLALQARDAKRTGQLAQQTPGLLSTFTEWAELENTNYWPLGYTALHYAVGVGDMALVDALVVAGADVNAPSKRNFATPLHVAVMQRRATMITRLLAAGANVGAVNCNGQSALHFAAYRGDPVIVRALLAAGAAPALKDAGGRTPLDWALHRNTAGAAELLRQAGSSATRPLDPGPALPPADRAGPIFETGIKLIDLFAPLARGAVNAVFTPLSGVGKIVLLEQLIETVARRYDGHTLFLGIEAARYTGADFALELNDAGLQDAAQLFFARGGDEQSLRATAAAALAQANAARETLVMADALYAEVAGLQALIEAAAGGSSTVIWYGDHTAGAEPERFAGARAVIGFDMWRAVNGFWPAIDPLHSHADLMTGRQAELVARARRLLRRYEDLREAVERDPRGLDALPSDEARVQATRARKLHAFLAQPFSIAELWINTFGEYVPLAWALNGLEAVLDGKADDADEAQLRTIAGTHLYIRR